MDIWKLEPKDNSGDVELHWDGKTLSWVDRKTNLIFKTQKTDGVINRIIGEENLMDETIYVDGMEYCTNVDCDMKECTHHPVNIPSGAESIRARNMKRDGCNDGK